MASSVKFNVPGSVLVKMSGLSGLSGLQDIGYSEDGIEITERAFKIECKTDRYGGSQGPQANSQILGREADIRINFTEFNVEYLRILETKMPGNALAASAPGQIVPPGTLMYENGGLVRCLLYGLLDAAAVAASVAVAELLTPLNYPFCEIVDVSTKNVGTRFARASLSLTARQGVVSNNVVFWNRVTA